MGIDVAQAWDQVVAAIAEQFPAFDVKAGEDADRTQIKAPAILVDLTELEPDPEGNPTTGEWPCLVHFRAEVLYSFRQTKVRRTVASAAGALAAFVHDNRFGVDMGPGLKMGGGIVIDAGPDEFAPRAEQIDLWAVEWVHKAHIGDRFETEEGETPSLGLASWAPEIGPDHVDDYEEFTP